MVTRGGAGVSERRLLSHLAVRLGSIFIGLALIVIAMTLFQDSLASRWDSFPWIILLVSIGFGGFASLRIVRTPGQIESELLKAGSGTTTSPTHLRPMVGGGLVVDSWNTLIEQARLAERRHTNESSHEGREKEAPLCSKLDGILDPNGEHSSLMARAVRSVSHGLVVADQQGIVLFANRPAVALLGYDRDHHGSFPEGKGTGSDGFQGDRIGERTELNREPSESATTAATLNSVAIDLVEGADLLTAPIHERLRTLSVLSDSCEPRSAGQADLKNRTAQALEQLSQGGGTVTVRLSVGSLDNPATLRITRSRLQGRQEDVNGFVWVIQDVTQQALAEVSRDEFLQTATHELRTPLANLLAYAEALRIEDGISVEEQKEFCNIITEEAQRLNRLVDSLLSVGQLEAGSMVISDQRIEFARVLEEAIDNTRPQFEANSLTLQTDISPRLRNIRGDKEKLQAMLINVIGNAAKYTPATGLVRIVAKLREDWLEVSVEDTGIGIGPEDLPRIFDKFYRVQNEHVLEKSGNGLGLAFAREVARLHQGDITVESRVGEGSVFTIRIPAPDDLKVGG